jgi:hypothetical protein
VRAAEAFWLGKEEAFETAIDKATPPALDTSSYFHKAMVKDGNNREGVAWRIDILKKALPVQAYFSMWKACMETEIVATEAANRAIESLGKLDAAAKKFREVVKNDLTSMKASSDRVQTEVAQMGERYKHATQLLTSKEFEHALENAERMAAALKAISALSETKLSVAVFGGGTK